MTGMPQETPPPRTAFVKNYDRLSTLLLRTLALGLATATALDATCSPRYPFSLVVHPSWRTVAGGLATGDRDSDTPSNFRMQRSALRAAADPAR